MDGSYTRLTDTDYDTKLREMGNYLWELEQELLTADTSQDEAKARQVHQKISRLAAKRAGTRFNTRGVDDDGNTANFVEVRHL